MEDHRLKAFCLVVELKSFSKAAEAKHMTQSAMSHLIRNLENDLGMKLLHRHTKSVSPTSAGRLFYEHARMILEGYRRMEDDLHRLAGTTKGPLTVGATATVAAFLLPQALYDFARKYPEVRVDLSVANTGNIVDELRSARIELGIVEGTLKPGGFLSEQIASDELVLIASENHRLARKKSLSSNDLASEPFIMPEPGSGTREFTEEFLSAVNIEPRSVRVAMTSGSPELIIQMVQAGVGISLVSKWAVFTAVKEGTVAILDIPGAKFRRQVYLIALDADSLTSAAKEFRTFLKRYRFFAPF
ncbi:MAG: LysR substrate-binding domain-containing protein [Chloroflexota bacterium]